MPEVFATSGENSDNTIVPAPRLQGIFVPGIDDSLFTDGFGLVTPFGGGGTARKYSDYGISAEVSQQATQLTDLSNISPAIGGGLTYGLEGERGPQGIPGPRGLPGIISVLGLNLPQNSNFLAELPHNIDQINALGTAVNKLIYTDAYNTYTEIVWTERQPAGDSSETWNDIASDADGSNLIVSESSGRLYTSADSGVNWTERQPAGDDDKNWEGAASDSDGSHLIAAVYNGRLWTSDDSGATWDERRPAGDNDKKWWCVASDADGSHLMAGTYSATASEGRLYTSANYGVNWTERQPAGDDDFYWKSVASDSDGSHLIALASNGLLYTSANYGANWTLRNPTGAGGVNWGRVASDADGSNLIVSKYNGRIYTSDDYGVSWTQRQPTGSAEDKTWYSIASDSDGSHLVAGIYSTYGRLYASADFGVTWAEIQPVGDAGKRWRCVALDSDGSNLVAGISSGRLYTGVESTLYSEATWGESELTSAGRNILDDATIADQADTLELGTGDSPTWIGATLSAGPFNLSGKQTVGSFASPIDVTATRQYGVELHYSGNDYDVTGLRSRARLKTTDTTATAQGALLQAANEDGIDAGVLQGALIEAIGKSDANATTIAIMRGCLVNTEWGDYDTITNLKTLHVRTHSRNAAGAGSFGTGYGIYIENEAVGGNGQTYDAGIYFKGTNLSAGNKAFTYGIDFTDGTYGTSQINLIADGSISMAGNQVIKFDCTNYNILLGTNVFANDEQESNVGIGFEAGYNNDHSTGEEGRDNIYIGFRSGYGQGGSNKGQSNIGVGANALRYNSDGFNVVAIGGNSCYNNTTGSYIVGIGPSVLLTNTDGTRDTAIGYRAMYSANGASYCTAIGFNAMYQNVDGNFNVIIGGNGGFGVDGQSYSENTFIGYDVGRSISTGSGDIFIGHKAGYNQTTNGDLLIIDNQDRGSTAAEITNCLIYGVLHATPASQTLRFNVGSITQGNPTHSDASGGGATQQIFNRQDGAETETACFQFEASHDGAGVNDQLGKGVWSVNTGSGLVQALEIGSDLLATFAGAVDITGAVSAGSFTGLVIGTDVQAWDAQLDDIAALAVTNGNFIVGDGSNWVAESGATARTSIGLGTGDTPTFAALKLYQEAGTPSIGLTTDVDLLQFGEGKLTLGGSLFINEQASAMADVGGNGQIWIKSDAPNTLWFTDDEGTDVQIGVTLAHTIVSHSDTTATGAELEELTDSSETTLHSHAGVGAPETSRTINLLQSDNTAAKQAKIDAVRKYIPFGVTVIFQFEVGQTHTETADLIFSGYFGGGVIYIQGNTAEANANTLHTTQDTIIDVTAQTNIKVISILSCTLRFYILNFKIMLPDSNTSRGIYISPNPLPVQVKYNYIYAAGTTNDTRGVEFRGSTGIAIRNYVSSLKYGIMSQRSIIQSSNNDDTGTDPLYGLYANSGIIYKQGTQPDGSTANELATDGGQIF